MITGLVAFPTCAPVRCAAIAMPRLFGYLAARVPKAGACHRLVPNPMTATASPMIHSVGLMPMRKYPSPTISMLADSIHATFFRYMSASIPAGRFAMPELTELMVKIAPYAMSPNPRVALMNGIMTVSAPCPKCLTPCPAEIPTMSHIDSSRLRGRAVRDTVATSLSFSLGS